MNARSLVPVLGTLLLGGLLAGPGQTNAEAGSWVVRGGPTNMVTPSLWQAENTFGHRHQLGGADIDTAADDNFSFSLSYFLSDRISVELLGSRPFAQPLSASGLGEVAQITRLPPTLTMRYHFRTDRLWRPYVGAGFNWVNQIEDDLQGDQPDLSLDNTLGYALQAGVYVDLSDRWLLNFETRYSDVDQQLRSGNRSLGRANVDPVVTAIKLGYRF